MTILTRRAFLKVAGLSGIAVAGTACASKPAADGGQDSGDEQAQDGTGEGAAKPAPDGMYLTVSLDGSAGTGYVWSCELEDGAPLELWDTQTASLSEGDVSGGPEETTFSFVPTGTGTTKVTFLYARPWELEEAPEGELPEGIGQGFCEFEVGTSDIEMLSFGPLDFAPKVNVVKG